MSATLTITAANCLSEIERVSTLVTGFGVQHRIPDEAIQDANLALEEVLTNVISYGYADADDHEIEIRIRLDVGTLTLEVEDDAEPFNPLGVAIPDLAQSARDRPIGGLGVHLVRNVMTGLAYRRDGNKNVLTMSRVLRAP